jgi:hypothetical protein
MSSRSVDLVQIGCRIALGVKIGAQRHPAYARDRLNRQNPLGWYMRPIRDRRLRDAYFSGERAYAAGSPDRFVEAWIPH